MGIRYWASVHAGCPFRAGLAWVRVDLRWGRVGNVNEAPDDLGRVREVEVAGR